MTPKDPVGPAFDKAVDRTNAWRRSEERNLNDDQRREYDRMKRWQNDRLRAHDAKFQEGLHKLISDEKSKLLLQKPEPALRLLPGKPMKEAYAEKLAQRNVNRQHENERQRMEDQNERERDGFLHSAYMQRGREARQEPDLTAALRSRAAQKEHSRGDEGRSR